MAKENKKKFKWWKCLLLIILLLVLVAGGYVAYVFLSYSRIPDNQEACYSMPFACLLMAYRNSMGILELDCYV